MRRMLIGLIIIFAMLVIMEKITGMNNLISDLSSLIGIVISMLAPYIITIIGIYILIKCMF